LGLGFCLLICGLLRHREPGRRQDEQQKKEAAENDVRSVCLDA
jgi:hypothetical protein